MSSLNKPTWEHAPEWANYLAMNEGGEWYWYEKEPHCLPHNHCWINSTGKYKSANYFFTWDDTLEERPQ